METARLCTPGPGSPGPGADPLSGHHLHRQLHQIEAGGILMHDRTLGFCILHCAPEEG